MGFLFSFLGFCKVIKQIIIIIIIIIIKVVWWLA